ncbi:hypothetical protein SteCoe_12754 [Stentor coeruleus]|uniref:Casein kinase I n=1 Tax=Stentor coeruleus TaxID=5963 RepID=A0A1R2CA14_9CILI|nr:hypothetical protein SteCoe_12754 [Stentor coeruleus]
MSSAKIVIDKRFELVKELEHNEYEATYIAKGVDSDQEVVLKLEKKSKGSQGLTNEVSLLKNFDGHPGFQKLIAVGEDQGKIYYVTDILGHDLQKRFRIMDKHFSPVEVALIGQKTLHSISSLHLNGIIHKNINPKCFRLSKNSICLSDLSSCQKFMGSNSNHIKFKPKKSAIKNLKFCSMNAQSGVQLSRRDDLESWCYVLAYFLRGSLPWSKKATKNDEAKVFAMKCSTNSDELFHGFQSEYTQLYNLVRALKFEEEPDYSSMQSLLKRISGNINFSSCVLFAMNLGQNKGLPDKFKKRNSFYYTTSKEIPFRPATMYNSEIDEKPTKKAQKVIVTGNESHASWLQTGIECTEKTEEIVATELKKPKLVKSQDKRKSVAFVETKQVTEGKHHSKRKSIGDINPQKMEKLEASKVTEVKHHSKRKSMVDINTQKLEEFETKKVTEVKHHNKRKSMGDISPQRLEEYEIKEKKKEMSRKKLNGDGKRQKSVLLNEQPTLKENFHEEVKQIEKKDDHLGIKYDNQNRKGSCILF